MIHELVNPEGINQADLAIFIPSCQEVGSIALPVRKAAIGLKKFFPEYSSVIVNCDNCSDDGTKEAFFSAESNVPRLYASTPPGMRGKGLNLTNAFEIAAGLKARVVVILDANLLSIKSSWIKTLIQPILDGAAFTAPLYLWHKYAAPISRGFAYPLLRALFGRRVLQPICVDHAFSGQLNEIFRHQSWEADDKGFRSDLKMLSQAIMNKAAISQSVMAHPRISVPGDLDTNLSRAFSNVVQSVFELMTRTDQFWTTIKRSRPVALAGADNPPVTPPPVVEVNRKILSEAFIRQSGKYHSLWREYLSPEITEHLARQLKAATEGQRPVLPVDIWRDMVFEAAAAFKTASPDLRPDICASLSPAFLIKGLTVYDETQELTQQQYHAVLENEALAYEKGKARLVEKWTRCP